MTRVLRRMVTRLQLRPEWPGEKDRYSYQKKYAHFDFKPGERVLDIGSGGDPFPHATVLMDQHIETTVHRADTLVTNGKPFLLADIHSLPFCTGSFDYVFCSHLLEHVADPIRACSEMMRVGRRGFIETPTFAKDMLFAWAAGMHKWHVAAIADTLVFFEYSARQAEGIKSSAWRDLIFSRLYHPLQRAFYDNADLFNTMLCWNARFNVVVFRQDGSMEILGSPKRP
ncbi:MAG TPA: class I SAM-dependent methyltransferase [Terriglobia bacterium]|nr:class I SAM-dependent methyltransferase [Terriglobia bacterium]